MEVRVITLSDGAAGEMKTDVVAVTTEMPELGDTPLIQWVLPVGSTVKT